MEPDQYQRMVELQDSHWWFVAKRMIVRQALRMETARTRARSKPAADDEAGGTNRILEVGCGTGSMLSVLQEYGDVVSVDTYVPALKEINTAGRVGGNLMALPFADCSFRLVGCFDVLYHRGIVEVETALAEIHRVCQPGGLLVVTDAAFPILSGAHDVAVHGARRFRLRPMYGLLQSVGFRVLYGSYFHTLVFPVAAALRLAKRARWGAPWPDRPEYQKVPARSDLAPLPDWLNTTILALYQIERAMLSRFRLPLGLSLIVLARRATPGPGSTHVGMPHAPDHSLTRARTARTLDTH